MPETIGLEPAVAQALREDGRRIVITGAGGWLGLATLNLLGQALGEDVAKRVCAFGSAARVLRLDDGTPIMQRPLADMAWLPPAPSLVLHTAFLTKDRAQAMDEAQYRAANAAIARQVLAALDPIGAQGVFLASSGAAGVVADPVRGLAASPAVQLYGAMKLEDEARFAQWGKSRSAQGGKASGRVVVIGRLYALLGPQMNKPQAYAAASFMQDALAGRVIAVRSPRQVVRAYVAIREVMSLVFAQLLGGVSARFDSGGVPMELAQVAQAVADLVPGARVERAPITQSPPDIYHGDGGAYAALLARHAIAPVPLAQALAETLDYWRALAPQTETDQA